MLSEHLVLPSFPDYCQQAIYDRIMKEEIFTTRQEQESIFFFL